MSFPTATPGLADVQGNILKGHGRRYTALLFFRFRQRDEAAAPQNRRLLREAATGAQEALTITSAAQQQEKTTSWLASQAETTFRSLGLTTHGLKACGYTAPKLGITGPLGTDQFWEGATPRLLTDTQPWDETFAMMPDGVFLIANNLADERDRQADAAVRVLREQYGVGTIVLEKGFRWTPRKDSHRDETTYEHFGFADGFARTKLVADPASPLRHLVNPGRGFLKQRVEPFELPLEQVMIEDAGPFQGASFLVVHKLEQNVRAFLEAEAILRDRLGELRTNQPGRAGALFIGREPDGTPLAKGGTKLDDTFHFGGDPKGRRCPFSAHIRKMNPRQNKLHDEPHRQSRRTEQKSAQFLRRGVLYGDETRVRLEWASPAEAPDKDVGLLFMGYMSRIGAQFLKMYFNWGPEPDFPQANSGPDPLLGGGGQAWDWVQHPTLVDPKPLVLGQLVTSKGAGFFVIPPLSWLQTVA